MPGFSGFFSYFWRVFEGRYLRIRTTQVSDKPHCEDVEADLDFHTTPQEKLQ